MGINAPPAIVVGIKVPFRVLHGLGFVYSTYLRPPRGLPRLCGRGAMPCPVRITKALSRSPFPAPRFIFMGGAGLADPSRLVLFWGCINSVN